MRARKKNTDLREDERKRQRLRSGVNLEQTQPRCVCGGRPYEFVGVQERKRVTETETWCVRAPG